MSSRSNEIAARARRAGVRYGQGLRGIPALGGEFVTSLAEARRQGQLLSDVERYMMFVGYPRSGHSLVGSLVNAHPDAVIAHELDALRYVRAGFGRRQLFALLLRRDREFEELFNRAPGRYDYRVPGQWQGRVRRLRVIGDKKGGGSTSRLRRSPRLLDRLRRTVELPMRIVHVTRSPFDNIAAIHKMERRRRGFTLERSLEFYFALAETNARLEARVAPGEWLELSHDDLVARPETVMRELCEFAGLEPEESYLRDCAGVVYPSPNQTRNEAPWTSELIEEVRRRCRRHPFLERYADDVCEPAAAKEAAAPPIGDRSHG